MRCRRPLILTAVVAVAAFALLAAGCGGGGGSAGVASVTSATSATQSGPVAYSRCMRSNGVSGFPDPNSNGEIPKVLVVAAATSNAAKFEAAQTTCSHLLPSGSLGPQETAQQKATKLADALSFAKCMRSHGVARFPDPTAQGDLTVEMVQAQGIDVHSTAVLRIVQKCLPASHGGLTAAKVREAIDGTGGRTGG